MILYTLIIPVLLCGLISGLVVFFAGKTANMFCWEYSLILIPIVIWNILVNLMFGSQSLANIVEVYFLSFLIIGYMTFRVLKPNLSLNLKIIFTILILLSPFLFRAFFPDLPE